MVKAGLDGQLRPVVWKRKDAVAVHESNMTKVMCSRHDCMFYHGFVGRQDVALCKHADILHHIKNRPCPLYRLDWQSMASRAQQILNHKSARPNY